MHLLKDATQKYIYSHPVRCFNVLLPQHVVIDERRLQFEQHSLSDMDQSQYKESSREERHCMV